MTKDISRMLLVGGFSSHSRIFHIYGDVTITGAIFYLCSALVATEQRGFFSVPHLLWHGASVHDDGNLRGTVTLKPIGERFELELSLPVFTTKVCRCWDSNTQPSACGVNAPIQCPTTATNMTFSKYELQWYGTACLISIKIKCYTYRFNTFDFWLNLFLIFNVTLWENNGCLL